MDIFECLVDSKKLSATNKAWNQLMLNKSWVVGSVSSLIHQSNFRSKEEWKTYYFETGKRRKVLMKEFSKKEQNKMNSVEPQTINGSRGFRKEMKTLNFTYGRTIEDLNLLGDILYGAMRATKPDLNISRKECRYMVFYRVIGETWNGIQKREVHTIETLLKTFSESNVTIKRIKGAKDAQYEVDAELFQNNNRIGGLQIKPQSYREKFELQKETNQMNKIKNDNYTKTFGVPVYYIFSTVNGEIVNRDVLTEIGNKLMPREEQDNK